jgi:hypothetical protein
MCGPLSFITRHPEIVQAGSAGTSKTSSANIALKSTRRYQLGPVEPVLHSSTLLGRRSAGLERRIHANAVSRLVDAPRGRICISKWSQYCSVYVPRGYTQYIDSLLQRNTLKSTTILGAQRCRSPVGTLYLTVWRLALSRFTGRGDLGGRRGCTSL